MKTALIVNPCAGQRKAMAQVESIARIFEGAGDIVAVFVTRQPGDGTRLARKLSQHSDRLVCIGGDGTFHEVVQGVVECDRRPPVGYIPAGTTNDISRSWDFRTACCGRHRRFFGGRCDRSILGDLMAEPSPMWLRLEPSHRFPGVLRRS